VHLIGKIGSGKNFHYFILKSEVVKSHLPFSCLFVALVVFSTLN